MNLMCSYDSDGNTGKREGAGAGSYSCGNARILDSLAKDTLQFPGYIISDEGAVRNASTPQVFGAGTDVFLGYGQPSDDSIKRWLQNGEIEKGRLDDAARRTLLHRFLLGEFDHPEENPFWDHAAGETKHTTVPMG